MNGGCTVREASFYEKQSENKVRCRLCRHLCLIPDGKRGICCVRENRQGVLYSLVYGNPCSWHVDPIEKKPLYHFFPGSKAFSIATVGCNFRCLHCQNHEISQLPREEERIAGFTMSPEEVVEKARREGCRSISYTYTEPTMFYEYAFEIAKRANRAGLANNFVTNGYIEEEPLSAIRPFLDGANIDLKGFSTSFYQKVCGAKLEGVLASIRKHKALGIWIELTTLIIPDYNDSESELRETATFIAHEVGPETPWHVSAFYPTYKLTDSYRTPPEKVTRAREIGLEAGLRYVYTGNIPGLDGESTYCPSCRRIVIKRWGFAITEYRITDGACAFCGAKIDGIGM
jgi:pyruvate formate lyase activating enzyme